MLPPRSEANAIFCPFGLTAGSMFIAARGPFVSRPIVAPEVVETLYISLLPSNEEVMKTAWLSAEKLASELLPIRLEII